jgi:hypothetical protein
MACRVFHCRPSEYVALADLNANGETAVAIESLPLQQEGWERDYAMPVPAGPSFNVPA